MDSVITSSSGNDIGEKFHPRHSGKGYSYNEPPEQRQTVFMIPLGLREGQTAWKMARGGEPGGFREVVPSRL